ncbi:tetratricopeptide repeat (TPR)-like superfamily protein [Wolffia australiana]
MEALRPPPATLTRRSTCSSAPSARRRKLKWDQRQQPEQHRRPMQLTRDGPASLFPKSTPVPLLPHPVAPPLSRAAQLDRVLSDLELAISRGVPIDAAMFSAVLETCSQLGAVDHGRRLRRLIPPPLLHSHLSLSSKFVRLYASCGLLDEAHLLFDEMPRRHRTLSAFPWNSLIGGYADVGKHEDAIALYLQMEEEGVAPDQFTFPRVLKACAGVGSLALCEAAHRHAVRAGFATDPFVLGSLVSLYAKCGDIGRATRIFSKIPAPDAAAVTAIVSGLARHGLISSAMEILLRAPADNPAAVSTIAAAAPSPRLGAAIHGWALRRGLAGNKSVGNALIAMYGNHGRVVHSRRVFAVMAEKDVVSWNAVIAAHRRDEQAVAIFAEMVAAGVAPDEVTFVSLLDACAKTGMVDEGCQLFATMEASFGVRPKVEHLSCMVNLLGRAGLVDEAYELVRKMELEASPTVWGALLYACSLHGNVAVAEVAAAALLELEPDNAHNFELLAKVYSDVGRWVEAAEVKKMIAERGLG